MTLDVVARSPNGEQAKFFIFTQANGCPTASARAQTSAVRSYLAVRQHARKRQHKTVLAERSRDQQLGRTISIARAKKLVDVEEGTPPEVKECVEAVTQEPFNLTELAAPACASPEETCHPRAALGLTFAGVSPMPLSFPLDLTTEEKYSLHLYLTLGRQKLFGTSTRIKHCPISHLAQSLMQICPIYVLAHIVLGELLLSDYTRSPLRPQYYARSAQMYAAIREVLADPKASFCHKMWVIIQAAMVERTSKRPQLQAIHNTALDDFFESQGGLVATYSAGADDVYLQFSSRLYAGSLARISTVSPAIRQFGPVKERFIRALDEVQSTIDLLRSELTGLDAMRDSTPAPSRLHQLKGYLTRLSQTCHHKSTPQEAYETELGALFCILSIARTFVECVCSPQTILKFLHSVQGCFDHEGHSASREKDDVNPAALAYSISCVRCEIFPSSHSQTEFKISQTLVDAQRLFPFMSRTARAAMITWLIACISTTAHLAGHDIEFVNEVERVETFETQILADEIEASWHMRTPRTSRQS